MKGIKWSVSWQAVVLGTGIGTVTMISCCAGAAALMAGGTVGQENLEMFAAGILALSGLAGGLAALLAGGGAWDAALATLGELVVLLGLNSLLCGGQMEGISMTALALSGGCGGAMILRLGKGSRGKRRRRRR